MTFLKQPFTSASCNQGLSRWLPPADGFMKIKSEQLHLHSAVVWVSFFGIINAEFMISAMRHKFNPSGRVPSVQIYALFLARDMGGQKGPC